LTTDFLFKEFLSGSLDGDQEIHFRADTQTLQMIPEFEKYAIPTAIVTKIQRGAAIETFVSLDGDDFYQLDGNATKGMTVQKIYSKDKSINSTPQCHVK